MTAAHRYTPPSRRPAKYRKRRSRGPWLAAMVSLWRIGWRDKEIAAILSQLSSLKIAELEMKGRWAYEEVERHLSPWASGEPWTRRMVGHYRRAAGLRANPLPPQSARSESLAALRGHSRRNYQTRSRWGHLLPTHELGPRQCDILSLLRDNGEMTIRQLAAGFRMMGHKVGMRPLRCGGRSYLTGLRLDGLVERSKENARAFRLPEHVAAPAVKRLKTGVERDIEVTESMERLERLSRRIAKGKGHSPPVPKNAI